MQIGTYIGIPGLGASPSPGPLPVTYPLDDLSVDARHAWSFKQLYPGLSSAIDVYEDGGGTTAAIGFSGGWLDEAALLAHVGENNGYIRKWYDQKGTDDLTCGDNSWQIVKDGVILRGRDDKPVMRHVGTSYLQSSLSAGINSLDIDFFFQLRSAGNTDSSVAAIEFRNPSDEFDSRATFNSQAHHEIKTFFSDGTTSGQSSGNEDEHGHWYIANYSTDPTKHVFYQNNTPAIDITHGLVGGGGTLSQVRVGCNSSKIVECRELVVFGALSSLERTEVYDAVNSVWQIGPEDHPADIAGLNFDTRFRGSRLLYDALTEWSDPSDFDVTPAALQIDYTQLTDQQLADRWLMMGNDIGSIKANDGCMMASKWYVLDDGAGAGILGSGAKRFSSRIHTAGYNYSLATNGITMTLLDFPLAGGGQGNWMYANTNFRRRILQQTMANAIEIVGTAWSDDYYRTCEFKGKHVLALCEAYHYLYGTLSANQVDAVNAFLEEWFEMTTAIPSTRTLGNMEMEFIPAAALAASTPTATDALKRLAIEVSKYTLFGKADGSFADMGSDPGFYTAGYWVEGRGAEMGYGGRSFYSCMYARAITIGNTDWDFLDPVLDAHCDLRTHMWVPGGNAAGTGKMMGRGFNSRTGNTDEQNNASRQYCAASLYTSGRPLIEKGLPDRAGLESDVTSFINSLNTGNSEKTNVYAGTGWQGPLETTTPPDYAMAVSSWPDDVGHVPTAFDPNWYATMRAWIVGADQSLEYPHFRTAHHNKAFGADGEEEFWSYKNEDASGREFGFVMEAIRTSDHPVIYSSWGGGGRIESFWAEELGAILLSVHAKSGSDDGEDTRFVSNAKRLPNPGWQGVENYPITAKPGGNVIEIDGDYSALFNRAGASIQLVDSTLMSIKGSVTVVSASYNGGSGRTEINVVDDTSAAIGEYCVFAWAVPYEDTLGSSTFNKTGDVVDSVDFAVSSIESGRLGNVAINTGGVSASATATPLTDGLQLAATLTADATGQSQYTPHIDYNITALLRSLAMLPEDASISYDTGAGWAVMADNTPVTTQYLRLKRDNGTTVSEVYIYLPAASKVMVTPYWDQLQYGDARTKNILVDLHPGTRGVPVQFPAGTSITWAIRTTNPGVTGDALSMQINYPSSSSPDVCVGECVALSMTRFGGASPTFTVKCSTDGGSTYGSTITGHWYDDGTTYDFIGDDQASGKWPVGVTHLKVVGNDGAGDVDSNERALTAGTATLWHDDDFTDTNGVLWHNHTATPGPDAGPPSPTDDNVLIQSNNLVVQDGSTNGSEQFTGDGNRLWVVELKDKPIGSARAAYGFKVAFKCKNGDYTRYMAPYVSGTATAWLTANVSKTNTPGTIHAVEAGSADSGEYTTTRAWANADMCVAQYWDSDGTYMGGAIATNVSDGATNDGVGVHKRASSTRSGEAEYLKIWRFD